MTTTRKVIESTAAAMLLALFASGPVHADALNLLSSASGPDLLFDGLSIGYTYDSGTNTGVFTASGDSGLLCMKNQPCLNTNAPYHYSLTADLTGAGSLLSGSLSLLDGNSNSVLSASLNAFGASSKAAGTAVFEFTTDRASGWLTADYPALQSNLGIITSVTTGINFQDLTHAFSTTSGSTVYTDNFAVPVPAAAWLFGSGLIGLVAVARRGRGSAAGSLVNRTSNS